jgi:carbonic anhydrase/acetyltransferase-like protein (isoleucine patch superfamily)
MRTDGGAAKGPVLSDVPMCDTAGPATQTFGRRRRAACVMEGNNMAIYQLGDKKPVIPASCFVAENATIIGDVTLGERVSILFGAVLRGDNEPITIGDDSNVQDNCVLHNDPGAPLIIGKGVTIGHCAILHGCTIGDGALIGIQAVVLNSTVIGKHCLVGAGAIVTERKSFPDRTMILGAPAKVVREVTDDNIERMRMDTLAYVHRGAMYKEKLKRIG